MTRAFVFPGQGSQVIGMGRELHDASAAARAVFAEVDAALGEKLSALMFEGAADELTLTQNAQPALMAVSLAALRAVEEKTGRGIADLAVYVAGHSLGEYSALAAAGAISTGDAARLLRRRGLAMQRAVPVGVGAMAALLGLDLDEAREIAREAVAGHPDEVCQAANDNAPGQVVVSGHKAAVERAVAIAAGRGAKRSIILPVSAPFHCALMQPAADEMAEALAGVQIETPAVPVVANVIAAAIRDVGDIRRLLIQQVTGAVRWRESVLWMKANGVTELVELGAGKVLAGLARRIDKELEARAINVPADVDAFAATLA